MFTNIIYIIILFILFYVVYLAIYSFMEMKNIKENLNKKKFQNNNQIKRRKKIF